MQHFISFFFHSFVRSLASFSVSLHPSSFSVNSYGGDDDFGLLLVGLHAYDIRCVYARSLVSLYRISLCHVVRCCDFFFPFRLSFFIRLE